MPTQTAQASRGLGSRAAAPRQRRKWSGHSDEGGAVSGDTRIVITVELFVAFVETTIPGPPVVADHGLKNLASPLDGDVMAFSRHAAAVEREPDDCIAQPTAVPAHDWNGDQALVGVGASLGKKRSCDRDLYAGNARDVLDAWHPCDRVSFAENTRGQVRPNASF